MTKLYIISIIAGAVAMLFNFYGIPAMIALLTGFISLKQDLEPQAKKKAYLGITLGIISIFWILITNLIK